MFRRLALNALKLRLLILLIPCACCSLAAHICHLPNRNAWITCSYLSLVKPECLFIFVCDDGDSFLFSLRSQLISFRPNLCLSLDVRLSSLIHLPNLHERNEANKGFLFLFLCASSSLLPCYGIHSFIRKVHSACLFGM